MKKKIKLIIIVIFILIITLPFFIFKNNKKLKVDIEKNIKISLNSEAYNTDFIKIKNGTITSKKEKILTDKIGTQEIIISVKDYFHQEKEYTYKLTVFDNISPVISYTKIIQTTEGTEIDLLKNVKVTDNSNEKIDVTIDGNYDFNKSGSYKLFYVAKDSSGNETKEEFTLNVQKKKVEEPKKTVVSSQDNNSTNLEKKNEDEKIPSKEITFTTSKGFKGTTKNGVTYIDGILIVNKSYSLPSSYGNGLTKETKDSFNKMKAAALVDGLDIYLSSGFRSYGSQNRIYNNYVKRDGVNKADTYSARPGHSEHQSGLAFDVNQINDTFNNTKEAKWLSDNCYKYGFILRYPKGKTKETGYKYESWHFRYVGKDLATKLYNNGDWITLEDYFGIDSKY